MNFFIRNEYRTEVLLSDTELEDLGVTFEELDYGNSETRRVLWRLLDEARQKTGVCTGLSGKLLIEAFREKKNSIRICFTSLAPHEEDPKSVKQLVKNEIYPVVADFSDFEDLLCAAKNIFSDDSSVFEHNGIYRFVVYPEAGTEKSVLHRLCEFGRVCAEPLIAEAESREFHKCLISHSADSVLRTAFSENQ